MVVLWTNGAFQMIYNYFKPLFSPLDFKNKSKNDWNLNIFILHRIATLRFVLCTMSPFVVAFSVKGNSNRKWLCSNVWPCRWTSYWNGLDSALLSSTESMGKNHWYLCATNLKTELSSCHHRFSTYSGAPGWFFPKFSMASLVHSDLFQNSNWNSRREWIFGT